MKIQITFTVGNVCFHSGLSNRKIGQTCLSLTGYQYIAPENQKEIKLSSGHYHCPLVSLSEVTILSLRRSYKKPKQRKLHFELQEIFAR